MEMRMASRDGPMLVDGQPFKIRFRVFNFHGGQTVGPPTGEYENLGQLRKHRRRLDRVEVVSQRHRDGVKNTPIREFLASTKDEPDNA
jgi:hypothetical protein